MSTSPPKLAAHTSAAERTSSETSVETRNERAREHRDRTGLRPHEQHRVGGLPEEFLARAAEDQGGDRTAAVTGHAHQRVGEAVQVRPDRRRDVVAVKHHSRAGDVGLD